jgi:hypothetical protein
MLGTAGGRARTPIPGAVVACFGRQAAGAAGCAPMVYIASTTVAKPWPTPMHIVARP